MTKKTSTIFLIFLAIGLLVFIGLYFVRSFLASFAPDEIEISKTEISSSEGFVNPITIEKIKVDSFGKGQRPVKYSIEYLTTCSIKQEGGKPPVPLETIKLNEAGRYSWSEERVNIPIVHPDGYSSRSRIDSMQGIIWSMDSKQLNTCPLKFRNGDWYFVNFLNPQIVGIYIYIDSSGTLKQYPAYSGVSPI
jgi:hypothetical protein